MSESPNSTKNHVRKFLRYKPEGASKLTLKAIEQGGEAVLQLGRWPAEAVTEELADDLLGRIDAHVVELGCPMVATLEWWGKPDPESPSEVLGTKVIKRKQAQAHKDQGDIVLQEQGQLEHLDGSSNSIIRQMQHHLEHQTRLFGGSIAGLMQISMKTNEHCLELLERMASKRQDDDAELRRVKRERDEFAVAVSDLQAAQGSDPDEEATARSQATAMKFLEPLIPLILAKLGQGGGGVPPQSPVG